MCVCEYVVLGTHIFLRRDEVTGGGSLPNVMMRPGKMRLVRHVVCIGGKRISQGFWQEIFKLNFNALF
jgi:hypothetical protein